jgi:hypothetical protein
MNPATNSPLFMCMCYCSRAMFACLACSTLPLPHFVLPNLTLPYLLCFALPHFVWPYLALGPQTVKNRLSCTLAFIGYLNFYAYYWEIWILVVRKVWKLPPFFNCFIVIIKRFCTLYMRCKTRDFKTLNPNIL